MIVVDTTVLKQLANAAGNANDAIQEAAGLLNQVATHNDWGCKERNRINEFTLQNKNTVQRIREEGSRLYSSIAQAANQFEEIENRIPSQFQSVDNAISSILAIPTPVSVIARKSVEVAKSISSAVEETASRFGEGISAALEEIRVIAHDSLEISDSASGSAGNGGGGGGGGHF